MPRNRMDKEKFYVEIFMTDNGLSVGMSLEQRSKVKLLFQSCSHRTLHMLEIPWKDYLMEEKKSLGAERTSASPIEC